jgi:hypothetical protein
LEGKISIPALKSATLLAGTRDLPIKRGIAAVEDLPIVFAGRPEFWKEAQVKSHHEIVLAGGDRL